MVFWVSFFCTFFLSHKVFGCDIWLPRTYPPKWRKWKHECFHLCSHFWESGQPFLHCKYVLMLLVIHFLSYHFRKKRWETNMMGASQFFRSFFPSFFPIPQCPSPREPPSNNVSKVNSFQFKGGVEKPHNKSFHSISSIFKSKNPSLKNWIITFDLYAMCLVFEQVSHSLLHSREQKVDIWKHTKVREPQIHGGWFGPSLAGDSPGSEPQRGDALHRRRLKLIVWPARVARLSRSDPCTGCGPGHSLRLLIPATRKRHKKGTMMQSKQHQSTQVDE